MRESPLKLIGRASTLGRMDARNGTNPIRSSRLGRWGLALIALAGAAMVATGALVGISVRHGSTALAISLWATGGVVVVGFVGGFALVAAALRRASRGHPVDPAASAETRQRVRRAAPWLAAMYIALLLGVLPGMIVINRGHSRRSLSFGAVLILAGVAISFAAGIRSQLAVRPATRTILKFRPRTLITGVLVVSALLIAAQLAIGLTAPS